MEHRGKHSDRQNAILIFPERRYLERIPIGPTAAASGVPHTEHPDGGSVLDTPSGMRRLVGRLASWRKRGKGELRFRGTAPIAHQHESSGNQQRSS